MKRNLSLTAFINRNLPYLYFILGALFWFCMDLSEANKFNFIAFGLLTVVVYQLVYKKQLLGLCLSSVTMVVSFFMFFAVLSEFNDFGAVTNAALQLLIVGMLISCSAFMMGLMLFKRHILKT